MGGNLGGVKNTKSRLQSLGILGIIDSGGETGKRPGFMNVNEKLCL